MNKSSTFHLQDVSCRYPNSKEDVLRINHLLIPSGARCFFIGASGIGKSTLLETLGLMNNTVVNRPKSIFNFNPQDNSKTYNLIDIWGTSERQLSKVRRQNFSFIFQSTNLFKNLSFRENAIITSLLQGDSKQNAILKSSELIQKIFKKES